MFDHLYAKVPKALEEQRAMAIRLHKKSHG